MIGYVVKPHQIEQYDLGPYDKHNKVGVPEHTAVISIGSNFHIQIADKIFTEEQIKNMRKFFGWEVRNLWESQSET